MKNYPKVAADMIWVQMLWTFGFLGVMFIITIIKIGVNFIQGTEVDGGFYPSVMIASNIYMLIIGIIAIYFLPYYVENGVTRKDAFKGTLLSSIVIAIAIPIISLIISIIERFLLTNFTGLSYKMQNINETVSDVDGNIIADIILSVILTPYVDPGSNWALAIGIFSLNIFIFYLLGWLIGAGFYTGGTIIGLVFILFSIIISVTKDALLRASLDLPLSGRLQFFESLSTSITIPGILLLIIISVWIIRLLTKKVPIKM